MSTENNIIVECMSCKYKDKPDNFNAFLSYDMNKHPGEFGIQMLLTIECPVCLTQQFFQHFSVDKELVCNNPHNMKFTYAHNVFTHDLCDKAIYEQSKGMANNLVELKKKYVCNLQEVKE
jgi:hypothetical protein